MARNPRFMQVPPYRRGYWAGRAKGQQRLKNYMKCCAIRARRLGLSAKDVAEIVNVTPVTVGRWRKEKGGNPERERRERIYMPNGRRKRDGLEITYFGSAWLNKYEIAAKTGRVVRKKRVPKPRGPSPRVRRMFEMRRQGLKTSEIAAKLGISRISVYRALKRWEGRPLG